MSDQPSPQPRPGTARRKRARKMLLQALYQWRMTGASLARIEAEFRSDNDMGRIDEAFFSSLLREIPKVVDELDAQLQPVLDRKIGDVDPIELSLLRIGVYEFMHRLDVPYRVVINEAVELARQFGGTDGHKYINGILDKLSRRLRPAETGSA